MTLRVERVTPDNVGLLARYCAEHGAEHDSSYLPGRTFEVTPQQPSCLLLSNGAVVGAVSLMLTSRYTRIGAGRFAILHSTLASDEAYARLLAALQPYPRELRKVFLFLPEHKQDAAAILRGLGFTVERYSFVLRKAPAAPIELVWPDGLAVEALGADDRSGAQDFARCINDSFARLTGHADLSGGDIHAWFADEGYLDGGIGLLKKGGAPIGTVMVMREYENAQEAEVVSLGIVTAWQGRGFGRLLLRYAVDFAARRGFRSVVLSVNAENQSALRLYTAEGFQPIETMVCYARTLEQASEAEVSQASPQAG